eukprot:CAMPEP_0201566360 /NCGR_PEP_ID=MMETSP0190_2-20130828/6103_1 /ASSEMBLY_ACC=CAM_ASM_000263 /TAXON_ID=37353 /ORGANISM="Rosalina sp." /LENGTH=268 /DNA_ID=CAMNT_0047984967 /DNA_START=27 /DNA_END=833 /DNA_ORIENTATION=-
MALDARLLNNDYDAIAQKINNLSQDIQYIKRQSDLVGGIDDTTKFRKQLTAKIQSTSKTVMVVKNQLQKAEDNGGTGAKWKKLQGQFMQNFERLRDVTSAIGTKFKQTKARAPQDSLSAHGQQDRLLDNAPDVAYGTTSNGHSSGGGRQQQQQAQQQEEMFRPYDDLYELENYEEQLFDILQNLQLLYESHKDLNMLIYDQDEIVEQLHDNVVDARDNVQSGVEHLDKAASHQKAYRGKLCILLGILLVIAVIVTVVVVLNSNSKKKN